MNNPEEVKSPHKQTVLITDDDKDVRWALSSLLKHEGFNTLEAESGSEALKTLLQGGVDVMLLDFRMADMDGLKVLKTARNAGCDTPIIFLSGFGTTEMAIEAGRLGACGFLTKPFKKEDLVLTIQLVLEGQGHDRTKESGSWVGKPRKAPWKTLGVSKQSQRIHEVVNKIAPTDYTVVINGETGVGKELVAQMIHHMSHRGCGKFVALDCGSITPTLIESELFGHEKGAFTGATTSRPGIFEAAQGGTLFLDEITNLPISMQAKLLRVLQERQVCRVGSTKPIKIDVRVLAATNENLENLVDSGAFRSDLFYRLNEFNIPVSPLRERGEDIIFLAQKFILEASKELHKEECTLDEGAKEVLVKYGWPGNVRELRNIMRRAVLVAENATISPEHLHISIPKAAATPMETIQKEELSTAPNTGSSFSFKEIVRQKIALAERDLLLKALNQAGGNMAEAARTLNIDYKTMREKSKEYQLSVTFTPGRKL